MSSIPAEKTESVSAAHLAGGQADSRRQEVPPGNTSGPALSTNPQSARDHPRTGKPIDVLDSWKEIAVFLRRGVRTVQRWERLEGLPVRRHKHSLRGSVFALASEIAAWQKVRHSMAVNPMPAKPVQASSPRREDDGLASACCEARWRAAKARGRFQLLREVAESLEESA